MILIQGTQGSILQTLKAGQLNKVFEMQLQVGV